MIMIVSSIVAVLAVLLTAFVSFNPNFTQLVNRDFLRNAEERAFYASLEYGQIEQRTREIFTNDIPTTADCTTGLCENYPLQEKRVGSGSWEVTDTLRAAVKHNATSGDIDTKITH
ncbi:MAG: hypothetical protein PHV17_05530 [Candidatus Omnitrophica bacterium]|nr:hypothetical protein [Candidatus Omnitrophota bacterium]